MLFFVANHLTLNRNRIGYCGKWMIQLLRIAAYVSLIDYLWRLELFFRFFPPHTGLWCSDMSMQWLIQKQAGALVCAFAIQLNSSNAWCRDDEFLLFKPILCLLLLYYEGPLQWCVFLMESENFTLEKCT